MHAVRSGPNTREFWFGIDTQEKKHVLYIQKMKAIIEKKPQHFEKGRPFNIMAAQTIIKGVQSNTLNYAPVNCR